MNRLTNVHRHFRLLPLLLLLWFVSIGSAFAQTLQDAEAVVKMYVASLKSGDVGVVSSLVGGSLAAKSAHINSDPEKYSDFL